MDYLEQLKDVFAECRRVLEPGGRIAINVANLGRKPYRSLSADIITILQDELGFLLRGEIIWQKGVGASGNCAWGSFMRPSNPVLRDLTERVIVASKGRFDRAPNAKRRAELGLPHEGDDPEGRVHGLDARRLADTARVGDESRAPAPFPIELPPSTDRALHLPR